MKNKTEPKFKYELSKIAGAENIMLCFQCGTCTADCPISRYSEFYRHRRIARLVQLGYKEELLSDNRLWLCTTCFACVDHCPQNVEPASIVRALRNLAIKEKRQIPHVTKELAFTLLKTGYIYRIPELRLKQREQKGLPQLPKTNLSDIANIFKTLGITDVLENTKIFEKVEK